MALEDAGRLRRSKFSPARRYGRVGTSGLSRALSLISGPDRPSVRAPDQAQKAASEPRVSRAVWAPSPPFRAKRAAVVDLGLRAARRSVPSAPRFSPPGA